MRITYDKDIDAIYIRLLEGDFQCRPLRLSENVALNIGPDEQLVGIEILDASRTLNLGDKKQINLENLTARLAG
jgi:uncharacterized protein YuzE